MGLRTTLPRVGRTTVVVGAACGLALAVGFNAPAWVRRAAGDECATAACRPLTVPEARLVELVGAQRAAAGCVPLRLDDRLRVAARASVESLAKNPSDMAEARQARVQAVIRGRAEGAGYDGDVEVLLAVGLPGADAVVAAWRVPGAAPAAQRALARCDLRDVAVAHDPSRTGTTYGSGTWVLLMGRP